MGSFISFNHADVIRLLGYKKMTEENMFLRFRRSILTRIFFVFSVYIVFYSSAGFIKAGELKAGISIVNITPPVGTLHCAGGITAPYRDWKNRGIHDSTYAKILVLSDGIKTLNIISLDLLGFNPEGVRKLLSPNIKNTLFCASHNHSGAATVSFTPPKFNCRSPYLAGIEKEIADAITDTHSNLVSSKIGVGKGTVDLAYNKFGGGKGLYLCGQNNPDRIRFEPIDPEVGVIRVDDSTGKPLAILVNYTSHPVVVPWTRGYVSAGYPGYMSKFVEKEIGGNVNCFFINGACGDVQPYESCSKTFEKGELVGRKLADAVLEVNSRIETVDDPETKIEFIIDAFTFQGRKEAKGMKLKAEMNTVLINKNIAFVSGPGEFYVDYQLDLKKRSPVKNTFFWGYTNGYMGYFPTLKAWKEDWTQGKFEHNKWVEVGAGKKMIEKALENINILVKETK